MYVGAQEAHFWGPYKSSFTTHSFKIQQKKVELY